MLGLWRANETFGEKVHAYNDSTRETMRVTALGAFLAATLTAPALAVAATASSNSELAAEIPTTTVAESVTVTDSRLRQEPRDLRRVAAHVTLLRRDEIEASGAATLQELLAAEAGVVLFDASGHDVGRTLDLRGFTGGGIKVFLDGAPLNDPRNNLLSLELVPTVAVERVEITRGSSATQAGGGSEAGVINLWTRRGDSPGGRLALAAGDFSTLDGSLSGWQRTARADVFASGSWSDTDGHRVNAGGTLTRLAGSAGWDLRGQRRLRVSLLASNADFGNPGALRPDELTADRRQAPFNQLDFSDEKLGQLAVNYAAPIGESFSLTSNVHFRRRNSAILSTGRAAPSFGGFLLDSATRLAGSTAQIAGARGPHQLVGGLEWLGGDTEAAGFFTPPGDLGNSGSASPGSDNTTERRTRALYLQDSWQPAQQLTLIAGLRWDEEKVGYRERVPDPNLVAQRTYAELSARLGAAWTPAPPWTLYGAIGEAFLPPTVEELFSFPLFGSNPDLEAEDSRSLELGLRRIVGRHRLDAALYRIDTQDEIVFDPDSPLGLFGANVNAGETSRRGLEISYRGTIGHRLRLFATATTLEAEFRAGPHRGRRVPLVPEERLSAGFDAPLGAGFELHGEGLWVGDQVLDNDDANQQARLDPYFVVNTRLTWSDGASAAGAGAFGLFLEVRNLLDREYASRGIYAFDFSALTDSVFLTPAPPRRLMAGCEWSF